MEPVDGLMLVVKMEKGEEVVLMGSIGKQVLVGKE